jgi:hypothetical protein
VKRDKDPLNKEPETKAIVKFLASGALTEIERVKELLDLQRTEQLPTREDEGSERQRTKADNKLENPSGERSTKKRQELGHKLEID